MRNLISNEVFQKKFHEVLSRDLISQLILQSRDVRRKYKVKEDKFLFKHNCSLCDAVITDIRKSHNALPLSENRCCEACNEKVIAARLELLINHDKSFFESRMHLQTENRREAMI